MILTSELSQQVVDSIIPLVNHNVNIMNNHAMIIGSGHKMRIDTFHKGAEDVLESGNIVEIYPEDVSRYPGSIEGVNMPIIFEGEIVGVVGVTGHPNEVRSTAQIVKAFTELILERELLREEFRNHMHLEEQLAVQLLLDTAPNVEDIKNLARLLKFNLLLPRFVIVVDVEDEMTRRQYCYRDLMIARNQENIIKRAIEENIINAHDLAVFLDNKLIIIKCLSSTQINTQSWANRIMKLCNNKENKDVSFGIGSVVLNYLEYRQSYNEALFALKYSRDTNINNASIYSIDTMADYLMSDMQKHICCRSFDELYAKSISLNEKYDMVLTLKVLIDNNFNISAAAKELFIHRNTLLFRLEKLKDTTALEPCQHFKHAVLCCFLLYKFNYDAYKDKY